MAAPSSKHGDESDEEILTESDHTNPDLDVLSPEFDPLKALYSSSVVLPFPNAACFNNLSEYESFMSGRVRGMQMGRGRGGELSANQRNKQRKKELKAREAVELQDTKKNVMRNVLSRMTEQTEGPYSLLYMCVQKRCKVRVCVRSFKGLRGICTGYLVAFDREMNMALSDVDEVYRIPSTGQRFYHEEKLTYSKIIENSKIRPNTRPQSVATSQYGRKGDRPGKNIHAEPDFGRGQRVTSKETESHGGDTRHLKQNTKSSQGSRTDKSKSKDEDKKKGRRRKEDDGEEDDEENLRLKLESLKEELARLSPEDPRSSVSDKHLAEHPSVEESKAGETKTSKAKTQSKTSGRGDDICKPMAFEKQLMKSRTDKLQRTHDETVGSSHGRTKGQRSSGVGSKSDCKSGGRDGKEGSGKLRIQPEDFQRRHVNQLFVRGDNVVLVSVDKALLGKK